MSQNTNKTVLKWNARNESIEKKVYPAISESRIRLIKAGLSQWVSRYTYKVNKPKFGKLEICIPGHPEYYPSISISFPTYMQRLPNPVTLAEGESVVEVLDTVIDLKTMAILIPEMQQLLKEANAAIFEYMMDLWNKF